LSLKYLSLEMQGNKLKTPLKIISNLYESLEFEILLSYMDYERKVEFNNQYK
jgi:hypothetical protein